MSDSLESLQKILAPKVHEIMSQINPMLIGMLAILGLVVWIAVLCIRSILIKRQLQSRISTLHLPVITFDPSPEEVARAARRLARVRPARWLAGPRRATALRVLLATGEDGRVEYRVIGPSSARSIVEGAPFSQVEVIPENALAEKSAQEEEFPRERGGGALEGHE
ncbi:hypothetical protein MRI28_17180 [Nocardiopsis dassonvillei]|uniref:hypothetical protein n=1 Tax=Nocardiopsis dassonvillei TaxID=2014 RepID=UPI00200E20BB|nr:hypothetical protein [Nocardiopsis dassonvillei]MCK9871349.1 hypothetical protein [Nocardiopsis dassonvillei]